MLSLPLHARWPKAMNAGWLIRRKDSVDSFPKAMNIGWLSRLTDTEKEEGTGETIPII